MRAREFIFEDYKDAKKEFGQVADPAVVQDTIDQYKQLVNKNQFRNPIEKSIDHWRKQGWEAFSQMVKLKSNDVTDTQLKKGKVIGKTIILQNDAEWTVVIPLDKESSVHYGRGTEWCTTKPYWSYFEDYVYKSRKTLIYAIDKTKAGRSVAISIDPNGYIEMFNQNDDPIYSEEYTKISGLKPGKFVQMAELPENTRQLQADRKKYKLSVANTKKLLKIKPLDPDAIERELKFTKNGIQCYNYILAYGREQDKQVEVHSSILVAAAEYIDNHTNSKNKAVTLGKYINFSKIPIGIVKTIVRSIPNLLVFNYKSLTNEQQQLIPTSAAASYFYATEVLNNPFPAGEAAIATDATYALAYAREFFNDGWPAGEAAIATDAESAYEYATEFFNDVGWPAGEAAIAKSAEYSYKYAYMLQKPFPAGEAAIATDATYALAYAREFFNDGWPAGEAAIAADAESAYEYASYVLKKPFPAGEASIATDAELSFSYAHYALEDKPFPAGEAAIATDANQSYKYAYYVLKKPFPAGEAAIATDRRIAAMYDAEFGTKLVSQETHAEWVQSIKDDAEKLCEYAMARNRRFPAGEAVIATNADAAINYAYTFFKHVGWPAGEAVIAADVEKSYDYARLVLEKPFPAGEAAIATHDYWSSQYADKVLVNHRSPSWEQLIKDDPQKSLEYAKARKTPFPAGEAAIATNPEYAAEYDKMFGTNLSQQ